MEAEFTPEEAIQIASLNGARFLKEADHLGSLAAGKQADIMLVNGDPSKNIEDIENVEIVFKDGLGYDSKKLLVHCRKNGCPPAMTNWLYAMALSSAKPLPARMS